MDVQMNALPPQDATSEDDYVCSRCEERVNHLRGSVCDFCADQLEEIERA